MSKYIKKDRVKSRFQLMINPIMKDEGSIILNSSVAGVKGFPGTTVYSAVKRSKGD